MSLHPLTALRTLTGACALLAAAYAGAAPVLLVDANGILTGANNVNVAGTLYNVSFVDGSCNSLFSNCSASSFAFSTESGALTAAQALLDQVLLDGALGNFDSDPTKTRGCGDLSVCQSFIPYGSTNVLVSVGYSFNSSSQDLSLSATEALARSTDMGAYANANYAVFTLAAPAVGAVPEPSSIALAGLALGGLAFARRRQHQPAGTSIA